MTIHHNQPLLISWDPESECYLVSDFGTSFKPIKTEATLGAFIREYHTLGPRVKWTEGSHVTGFRRSEDLEKIEAFMKANAVERKEKKPIPLGLEDLDL